MGSRQRFIYRIPRRLPMGPLRFYWNELEPSIQGQYNWAAIEPVVDNFKAAGFAVLANVVGTPSWAASSQVTCAGHTFPSWVIPSTTYPPKDPPGAFDLPYFQS